MILIYAHVAFSGTPTMTTFQTKIIGPTGAPLEAPSVNFRFTILDSAGTCTLYVEDYNALNMSSSAGIASFSLGSGSKQYPAGPVSMYEVFNNSTPSFPCQGGGTFSPSVTERRQIVMQFNDGSGWQTLPQMAINSVFYANYANRAESLGAYIANDYLRPATLPSCTGTQALSYDGTTFTCITASGGGGGGVTNVTGTAPIAVATGSSTPVISITKASAAASGYLSSADWTTFNGKANSVVGAGKLYLGNASGDATGVTLSGDATLATSGVMTLANSGVTAGTYGSASAVPYLTVDAKGRITSATSGAYQDATNVGKGIVQIGTNITLNSGVISVTSSDITNALGYTPASSGSSGFTNGGNAFSADATLGATSNFGLNLITNNLNRLSITSAGKIGVGTTTPNAALDVAAAGTASSPAIRVDGAWYTSGTGTTTKPQLLIEPAGTVSSNWSTAGTGIGVNAASTFTGNLIDLQKNGSSVFGVDSTGAMYTGAGINPGGNILLNGGQGIKFGSVGSTQIMGSGYNSGADYLDFRTANTNRMYIDNSGNIGIGTSTPSAVLDVSTGTGTVSRLATRNAGSYPTYAIMGQPNTVDDLYGQIAFGFNSNGAYTGVISTVRTTGGNAALTFSTTNDTGNTTPERMRIDNLGNVGIGTSTPGYKLHVIGDINITGNYKVNGVSIGGGSGTVTNVSSANGDIVVATGSTTPVLTLNSGTSTNQIVKLTAAGKYPAVDGSLITNLNLASGTGTLPIASGGTNSSTALNNNRIMVSSSGKIVEASALTNGQLFIGSTGSAPVASTLSAGSGILITNGTGTISTAVDTGLGANKIPVIGGVAAAANSLLMVNGTGTALIGQTCNINEILKWDGTQWSCVTSVSSQWVTVSSDITYPSGNVGIGIGTSSPSYRLSLVGTGASQTIGMERETTAATAGRDLSLQAGGAKSGSTDKAGGNLNLNSGIATGDGGSSILLDVVLANQGSGTTSRNPTTGIAAFSGLYRSVSLGAANSGAFGSYSMSMGYNMQVHGDYSYGISMGTTGYDITQPNTMAIMGGNVGIGTTTPSDPLQVNGNIKIGGQNTRATSTNRGQLFSSSTYITTANTSTTIDWNNGNIQELNTFLCDGSKTLTFNNLKDGAAYTLLISGTAAHSGTCNFSASGMTFKSSGGATAPTASRDVLFTFAVINNIVVYNMIDNLQ